ncbi:MAG: hypothetical protein HY751_08670 [Nitrospinae bacterium]|nr:hypothetical protein [Nitrospinota bacterium]
MTFKMYAFRVALFAAALGYFAPGVSQALPPDMVAKGWEDRIRLAIVKISNTDFEDGLKIIDEYIKANPGRGDGYFYYAAGVQEKIQKLNDLSDLKRFSNHSNTGIEILERALAKNPNDTISRMYLGAMYGYMGLLEARQRNMLQAFMDAVEAKKNLERAMAERPDIPDIYFGLGMIYYFASRKSAEEGGMTAWVITKFITNGRDMRKEGVEMIRRAVEGKSLSEDYARAALMWISLYEKNYPRARDLGEYIAVKFPRDAGSRWVLGRVALVYKDCSTAQHNFSGAMDILKKRGVPDGNYRDVGVALQFAELCEGMERQQWEFSEKTLMRIDDWLKNDKKITLEYQDEKNLLSQWRKDVDVARKSMRFIRGE